MAYETPNNLAVNAVRGQQYYSVYDVNDPEYKSMLVQRFGLDPNPFWSLWRTLNRETPIRGNGKWYGYETNHDKNVLRVLNTVAGTGAGNPITFVLDTALLDSLNHFYGREGQIVTIPVTNVQAWISDITQVGTTVSITLMPVLTTDNIGTLTAGTTLSITSDAWAPGTGQPSGVTRGFTKRTFDLQIFKETVELEGQEPTTEQYFKMFAPDGKEIPYAIISDLTTIAQKSLNRYMNGAFLLGKMATNTSMTQTTPKGATNTVSTTGGLLPAIVANGLVSTIAAGAFVINDLDQFGLYLKTQGVSTNVVVLPMGAIRRNEAENATVTKLQNTGVDYTKEIAKKLMGADPMGYEKVMSIGFGEWYKGGVHFLPITIDDFSDPVGLGATGYDLGYYMFGIPMSSFKDPVDMSNRNNIGTRYVAKDGYSRRFEQWSVKGAGGNTAEYTQEYDDINIYFRCHMGQEIYLANEMFVVKP